MPEVAPYIRFPTLAGERLAFVADDDVFVAKVPAPGAFAEATRLTAGGMLVSRARLSPDGALVAFTGRRDGAAEAYVVPVEGGEVRRLTHLGDATTAVIGWTSGSEPEVLVTSAAGQPSTARTVGRAIPLSGGPGRVLPYGPLSGLALPASPETGPIVVGVNQSRSRGAAWKRYRGGTAGALWIDVLRTGEFHRFLRELDGQLEDPALIGERVCFLSDHEGYGNLYSVLADGGDLRRHSDHGDFYARALSGDGRRLVYQCAGDCYLVEDLRADSQPRRLDVRLASTRRGRTRQHLAPGEHLGEFAADDEGRASLVEVRGGIYLLTHREGPARLLAGGAGVRCRLPRLVGRGAAASAVYVTDAEGEDALEIVPLRRPATPRRLGTGRLGRVRDLAGAPDGSAVAVATHDGRVVLVEVATGELRPIDRSDAGEAQGLTFSPDAALLAWSHAGPEPLRQIRLARLADGAVIEATPLRFEDRDPVFTRDGRFLAFLSVRTFDPLYDAHVFDLVFASATRPYLLPLSTATPIPFAPEIGGRARPGDKPADDADGETPVSVLDLEGLAERVVALPVPAGRYRELRAVDGGVCYLAEPLVGVLGEERPVPRAPAPRPWLQRFDLAERREQTLVDALDDYAVSADGRSLVVRDERALRLLPATRRVEDPDDGDAVEIDLARLRIDLDPVAEWRQMFDEAARLMRDHYFVADMSGVDWDATVARYRPLVERVATRDELSELIWEVQGELGTSHAYESPPSPPIDPGRRVAFLGADLEPGPDGLVVTRIVPAESSVPAARSPLAAAGVRAGEIMVALDGVAVEADRGVGELLIGAADVPVVARVCSAEGEARDVVVVPLASERPLRYQAWVAENRRRVHAATAGRVGYVHVPDMVGSGWAELHRDLRLEVAREALIVDVRDNRGGHISQLVIEKLARTVRGWDLARHRSPTSYPQDAPRGPLVAVADENAGSDGDIVTAAFKLFGLGPVVGTRTWGGVVGIDYAYDLVDGSIVTQPRYAFWFTGELGWSIENRGVDPDVEVVIAPQDWAAGIDPQLETAIALATDALGAHPAARPPSVATRPSRRPSPLPPRPSS